MFDVDIITIILIMRSGWYKFRDLLLLLPSRGLPLGAKGRLYSACVLSVMLYLSEI